VDVIVGAETGGIPLATAVALAGDLPFAFVRKPGYVGHEDHEPRVRGAAVTGRRVLLVDDAVSSGTALEAFADELPREGADLAGMYALVDMRDVATAVAPIAKTFRSRPSRRTSRCSKEPLSTGCSPRRLTSSPSTLWSTTGPTTIPAGRS
jgi:adenine/guanine phosphoribosyltransferase-like PRPP-binding protein